MSTIPSNMVILTDNSNMVTAVNYIGGSLEVSQGKKYKGDPTITIEKLAHATVYYVVQLAERHQTREVSSYLDEKAGGYTKLFSNYSHDSTGPNALNFAFGLSVTFTTPWGIASVDLYFGQGSDHLQNDWWLGSQTVQKAPKPAHLCIPVGGMEVYFKIIGDYKSFGLVYDYHKPATPIAHVFVLMLENHSFDNVLAGSGIAGLDGATTENSNSYAGKNYAVQFDAPSAMLTDPGHEFLDTLQQLSSQNTWVKGQAYPDQLDNLGFAANYATSDSEDTGLPPQGHVGDIMACLDTPNQLPVTQALANAFVVCDQWFSSMPGPTWPNRFFVHGATSVGMDDSPKHPSHYYKNGLKYPSGSIFDALKKAGMSWRLYQDVPCPYDLGNIPQVAAICGVDMVDAWNISTFWDDLNSGSYSVQYTFIEPTYGDVLGETYCGGSSQHPMDGMERGEHLLKRVYEAIRNSPLWQSSLLIVTYDEHGGLYDHVVPPQAVPPGDSSPELSTHGFQFDRLGVRVPAIVISPRIASPSGVFPYVDHTAYDHSSVVKTLGQLFDLPSLTNRDASANGLAPLISWDVRFDCPSALPKPLEPAACPDPRAAAEEELIPFPSSGNAAGFLAILHKEALTLSGATDAAREAALARIQSVRTVADARRYAREITEKVQARKLEQLGR